MICRIGCTASTYLGAIEVSTEADNMRTVRPVARSLALKPCTFATEELCCMPESQVGVTV